MAVVRKKKKKKARRKKAVGGSRGLTPLEVRTAEIPVEIQAMRRLIEQDGGAVVGAYRDPLGGFWQLMAALPLDIVKPTAFQRNLSETHVKRLAEKMDRLNRFLDPIIAIREREGEYLTPNGFHRISALQKLGAKSVMALIVPEKEIAYQILALNTEKAHNVREKSMEAIRMARELATLGPRDTEETYAAEFEEAPFLTLGTCYEKKGNFAGSVYYPVLRRTDGFLEETLGKALKERDRMAERLFDLDDQVTKVVEALKQKGLKSPFLKTFVVARVNPLRWRKGEADFDDTLDEMMAGSRKIDPAKIQPHHLAGVAGAPEND